MKLLLLLLSLVGLAVGQAIIPNHPGEEYSGYKQAVYQEPRESEEAAGSSNSEKRIEKRGIYGYGSLLPSYGYGHGLRSYGYGHGLSYGLGYPSYGYGHGLSLGYPIKSTGYGYGYGKW